MKQSKLGRKNTFNHKSTFYIITSCANKDSCSSEDLDFFIPIKEEFNVDPLAVFRLPIKIKIYEKIPDNNTVNITILDSNKKFYDSMIVDFSFW